MSKGLSSVLWLSPIVLAACLLGCPNNRKDAARDSVSAQLYDTNCSVCHGKVLEGRPGFAPALTGLKANWKSSDDLARYLADPQGYAAADPRLREQHGKFSMRMPAIPLTDEQRTALARWLLAQ